MKIDFVKHYFWELKCIMEEHKDLLIELDSVIGDGDLGLTMSDGFAAAYEETQSYDRFDIGGLLYCAGKRMASSVPSTMGTLMASGWMQAGKILKGKTEVTRDDLIQMFEAYEEGVMLRGKAKLKDKTFLDGLHPAIVTLQGKVTTNLADWAEDAAMAAKVGYEETATMIAVHGRAATRGKDSMSLFDPGAFVAYLMMKAFAKLCRSYPNE